jgi:hypothetical protein
MPITVTPYFTPNSLGTCQLWLDAADPAGNGSVPAYGTTFTTIADKSGNSRNFSVNSGTTYYCNYESRPSIFMSNSIMYNCNAVNLTSYTVFIICQSSNYGDNQTTFVALTAGSGYSDYNSYDSFGFYVDAVTNRNRFYGSINTNVVLNYTTPVGVDYYPLCIMSYSSTSSGSLSSYLNGNVGATQNASGVTRTGTAVGFAIGADYASGSFYTTNPKVFLNEVVVYNSVLSDTQRQQVEGYLAQKWNLTAYLPSGHLGLTSVITKSLGYTPLGIPGCSLWLDGNDASTFTLSGSSVTQWRDKSGNNNHMANNGTSPVYNASLINSLGGIDCTNGGALISSGFANSANISFAMVVIVKSGIGAWGSFFTHGSRDSDISVERNSSGAGTTIHFQTANDNSQCDLTYTVDAPALYYGTMTSGTSRFFEIFSGGTNSTITGTNSSTISIGTPVARIGKSDYGEIAYSYIGEILLFNIVLGTIDRKNIESYLTQKWGLTSSLPAGHPGLTKILYGGSSQVIATPYTSVSYAFTPTQISGCSLWLDGADPAGTGVIPASGASISTWADKSGLGNTATNQGSAGSVTFTAAGLVFNGSGYFYIPGLAGSIVNKAFVIFIVETLNTTSNTVNLFGDDVQSNYGTDNVLHIQYRTTTDLTFAFYSDDLENTTISGTGNRRVWTFWLPTASNRVIRRNGAVDVTHGNYNRLNYFTTPSIGRCFGGGTYYGTMSEIIIYPSDIGITNIQKVEAYLAQKWGLKSSLASGHVGLTTDYFNNQDLITRSVSTVPIPALLITGSATGGTITTANSYRTHAFTSVGSTNFVVTGTLKLQVLIVGGGGGGGFTNCAGGGGAGGAVMTSIVITAGTYSVVVGSGGTGGNYTNSILTQAANGDNSSFNGITGIGGGYGGWVGQPRSGAAGGCGGGGSYAGGVGSDGAGLQGGNGGRGSTLSVENNSGGGGGGMGGNGGLPNLVGGFSGGAGGLGATYVIGGTSYTVSGGGGGGTDATAGTGGSGIGGVGGCPSASSGAGGNGVANTGSGGGGGGGGFANTTGGNGGSGTVIIAYVYP